MYIYIYIYIYVYKRFRGLTPEGDENREAVVGLLFECPLPRPCPMQYIPHT